MATLTQTITLKGNQIITFADGKRIVLHTDFLRDTKPDNPQESLFNAKIGFLVYIEEHPDMPLMEAWSDNIPRVNIYIAFDGTWYMEKVL